MRLLACYHASQEVTGACVRCFFAILRHIESLGYAVSVFRIPSSLLGTVPRLRRVHAVKLVEPNDQHIAKVDGEDDQAAYRAACMLAESVGMSWRMHSSEAAPVEWPFTPTCALRCFLCIGILALFKQQQQSVALCSSFTT